MIADIIIDLQYGDCAKGKVAYHLGRNNNYTHVLRYNGGCNAGHTIFHNGRKFITHHIPVGVFFGVRSIIGSGCVVNPKKFLEEIKELEIRGIATQGNIFIAQNAHIITNAHCQEDSNDKTIGTTNSGNGPAYRDKYARTGIRAKEVAELKPYLIDLYREFHNKKDIRILCEGAQGFGLDIDWGDYPFVTSSHPTVAGALLNGIPPQAVKNIWGVAKVYETYVGNKKFEPDDIIFSQIRDAGEEYGNTTGRPRQCNWMNWNLLEQAIKINGVTHVVFNKVDVLRKVNRWALLENGKQIEFLNETDMKKSIINHVTNVGIPLKNIYFSESKDKI